MVVMVIKDVYKLLFVVFIFVLMILVVLTIFVPQAQSLFPRIVEFFKPPGAEVPQPEIEITISPTLSQYIESGDTPLIKIKKLFKYFDPNYAKKEISNNKWIFNVFIIDLEDEKYYKSQLFDAINESIRDWDNLNYKIPDDFRIGEYYTEADFLHYSDDCWDNQLTKNLEKLKKGEIKESDQYGRLVPVQGYIYFHSFMGTFTEKIKVRIGWYIDKDDTNIIYPIITVCDNYA